MFDKAVYATFFLAVTVAVTAAAALVLAFGVFISLAIISSF